MVSRDGGGVDSAAALTGRLFQLSCSSLLVPSPPPDAFVCAFTLQTRYSHHFVSSRRPTGHLFEFEPRLVRFNGPKMIRHM